MNLNSILLATFYQVVSYILDVSPTSLTVEVTGDSEKIDAFLELTKRFGIIEVARTGITALSRGSDPRPRGVDQMKLLDYE